MSLWSVYEMTMFYIAILSHLEKLKKYVITICILYTNGTQEYLIINESPCYCIHTVFALLTSFNSN